MSRLASVIGDIKEQLERQPGSHKYSTPVFDTATKLLDYWGPILDSQEGGKRWRVMDDFLTLRLSN
ncbi:hypothetical protein BJ165DRAFT_1466791, partial [Panaeolus papilionaceus]